MAPATGGLEYSILLMFLASLGLPLGVPPEPENPVLAYVAPQECLFYSRWCGSAAPNPDSGNHTEQLLAEPEVAEFTKALEYELQLNLDYAFEDETPERTEQLKAVVPLLLKTLAGKSTAAFVSKLETADEKIKLTGGMLVHAGPQAEQLAKGMRGLLDSYGVKYEAVTILEANYVRIKEPSEDFPNAVTFGALGPYILVGIGEGTIEGMINRVRAKEVPTWLEQLQKDLPIERRANVSYLDVQQALKTYVPGLGPQAEQVIDSLGLRGVTSIESVTGLDNEGMITRTLVRLAGEPKGLFRLMEGKGLTKEDLQHIPADAAVAGAMSLNAGRTYDLLFDLVSQNVPGGGDVFRQAGDAFQQSTGLSLREEALLALGDTWTAHVSPVDGWITGLTFSVGVNDPQKLRLLEARLVESLNAQAEDGFSPIGGVETLTFAGQEIHTVMINEIPFQPSWCVSKNRLYITLFPAAIKPLLGKQPPPALFSQGEWEKQLANGPVLSVSHQDAAASFEMMYTYASMLLPIGLKAYNQQAEQNGGPPLTFSAASLPSARSIHRHLQPSTSAVRKTKLGLEMESHRTMIGVDASSTVPLGVALTLPAVQAARGAARHVQSMNNMKQIGLGVHNFHDTYNGLPPAYIPSEEGKPNLSWRVMLLPFMEQGHLYNQFHLDEPWDSEHNKRLIPLMPKCYESPYGGAAPGKTIYLGVTGKSGFFVPPHGKGKEWRPGQTFAAVLDGTSNTVMVVEADEASAVIWTKPDDYVWNAEKPFHDLAQRNKKGEFLALFADGHVERLTRTLSVKDWEFMLDRQDGMSFERDK